MIHLHHLTKIYRSNSIETKAVDEVNFKVSKGEFVSIMGPSGCGKTTLLNIIGLLDTFDSGLFILDDIDVKKLNEKKKVQLRKSNIGFVFQNFNLLDELTVFENIELPLVYQGMKTLDRKNRVNDILDQIGLGHRSKHYPFELSGGQQQRVAVGRAIITKPKLILADEPTGNLDSQHGNEIMEMLSKLNEDGSTIIMVTHSMNDAAYTNRIVKLLDGQIVSEKNVAHA